MLQRLNVFLTLLKTVRNYTFSDILTKVKKLIKYTVNCKTEFFILDLYAVKTDTLNNTT